MKEGRKQITFDLDTKMLEAYYPSEYWRNAYEDIRVFMIGNRFEWQQGSVYVSTDPISYQKMFGMIRKLVKLHPWLNVCMRDCVVTNVGRMHSLNTLFDKDADVIPREAVIKREGEKEKSQGSFYKQYVKEGEKSLEWEDEVEW